MWRRPSVAWLALTALTALTALACDDTTHATVAPVLEPGVAPYVDEGLCFRITDDGQPSRQIHRGLLYFSFEWGVTQRIRYTDPRDDEVLNCAPDSTECHRVVDADVATRLPAGTPFTLEFRSTEASHAWLRPGSHGLALRGYDVEATAEVSAAAIELDAMPLAYRIAGELTGDHAVPLRAVAAAPL